MELRKAEYDRAKSLVDSKVGSAEDLDAKKAQYAGRRRALGEGEDACATTPSSARPSRAS